MAGTESDKHLDWFLLKKSRGKLSVFDGFVEPVYEPITSILITKDDHIILSAGHMIIYLNSDRTVKNKIHFVQNIVPDMTWVDGDVFAYIDQGYWFYSNVCIVKRHNAKFTKLRYFSTTRDCKTISYLDHHFYLASSNTLRIVNISGTCVKRINLPFAENMFLDIGYNLYLWILNRIRCFKIDKHTFECTLDQTKSPSCAGFEDPRFTSNFDSTRILVTNCCPDKRLQFFDKITLQQVGHILGLNPTAFLFTGDTLVVGNARGELRIYDVRDIGKPRTDRKNIYIIGQSD